MKGNVLDQGDPLVPAIDVDQGGLGGVMLPGRPSVSRHGLMQHLFLRLRCRVSLTTVLVARQSRRGSRLQIRLPSRWRGGRTEMCRDKLQSTLEPATDSGIASATVKTSHKVLPPPFPSHQCPTPSQVTKMTQTPIDYNLKYELSMLSS